jgi:hypothetical protein
MGLKQLIAGMSQDTQGAAGYTVPVGGLTDEVLSKVSAADGDFAWLASSVGGDAQGDSGKLVKFDPFGQLTGSTLNLTGYVIAGPSQQPAQIVFSQDDWTVGSLTIQGPQAPFSPGADFILTLPHHGDGTFILDTSPSYSGNAATATLAATVTTNANLTGHITSTGNATVLGSFTIAQLNTAVSDADVATLGANTFTANQTFSDTGEGVVFHGSGTITGASGAITATASGTNQNITLTPSGTGVVTSTRPLTLTTAAALSFGAVYIGTIQATGSNDMYLDTATTNRFIYISAGGTAVAPFAFRSSTGSAAGLFSIGSAAVIAGSTGTLAGATNDVGITRGAAGQWNINDGSTTATNYRDLALRNLISSGNLIATPTAHTATTAAISVAASSSAVTSTAPAQACTLADGTNGQIKTIAHVASSGGGTFVVTPATKTGYTTITFTAVGETATLQFFTTVGWLILSIRGAVAA